MSTPDVLHALAAILATAAALLALVRIGRGPTQLDRIIANDVLTASGIVLLAVMIVVWVRADLAVALILLALTGFLGPVVLARFVRRDKPHEKKILTQEEARIQREMREEEAAKAEIDELLRAEEEAQ
ncbi:hypothetical protein G7Y41_09095 [Schaalia sp. ZJ405]|uniref:monovalent cation/H+ antiporter complex subunit F n=1 Tax=unclassified Schaalia TaxID=2691889 RepID=UPI0013ECA775|nr:MULTISPECIES: monovalent cation/H+ antiporter complex subunit F [unclassified Schaalia]QPK81176.1 hypothetical protein G7Y41_09095 [Schaalia sp. ZJ405]